MIGKIQIRNSTVDFLVFTRDAHEDGIEVQVQDGNVWLTQAGIAELFQVDRSVVSKHLLTSPCVEASISRSKRSTFSIF